MGEVGGSRSYSGPGLGVGPWKCPACAEPNIGAIENGCVHCGSGSAQPRHVGQPPASAQLATHVTWDEAGNRIVTQPADLSLPMRGAYTPGEHERTIKPQTIDKLPYQGVAFEQWWTINEAMLARLEPKEVARLAWESSAVNMSARTMQAPPVTADIESLAPEGKVSRTIIAALELFKDQILRQAPEEIASGEWCSIEEVEQIIRDLKEREGSL